MMPCKTIVNIVFLALFTLLGCSKDSDNHPLYAATDLGARPKINMRISAPRYSSTSLPPDIEIHIVFGPGTMALEDAHQWVSQNAIIEAYPGQQPIAGKWSYSTVGGSTVFRPDSGFPPGDILLRFPTASDEYVISPRPFNLFRVGSALRLMEIDLLRDKANPTSELRKITLLFSEAPPKNEQVAVAIQQQAKDASWTAISAVMENQYTVVPSQTLDLSKPLRLSISSPSLDGKWTGQAGSGPLQVEFVPSEHQTDPGQVQYYVIPDLPINLPEGTPK